jgi:hypothetical protein
MLREALSIFLMSLFAYFIYILINTPCTHWQIFKILECIDPGMQIYNPLSASYQPNFSGEYKKEYWTRVRSPIKPYDHSTSCNMCQQCGKSYVHFRHLQRHQQYECGISPRFRCYYCPHRSRHKHNLIKHLKRRHDNEKIRYFLDSQL